VNPCASAAWVDQRALVTTDDCHDGNPRAFLFGPDWHTKIAIGGDRALDTIGAIGVDGRNVVAVLAPRAHAAVMIDKETAQQHVVDLGPIDPASASAPMLGARETEDHDWLVASANGGVGVIDHTTWSLTFGLVIPRCEATP
jgi:hypothetical protein